MLISWLKLISSFSGEMGVVAALLTVLPKDHRNPKGQLNSKNEISDFWGAYFMGLLK